MGVIRAFVGAVGGTFADQWKDIITVDSFDERTVISPGILRQSNNGRGSNYSGSNGVISNGSNIFVPENTAAFIFSKGGIEDIITTPGGYTYQNGQETIFTGDGLVNSLFKQVVDRVGYGGQTSDQKLIAFVNLREIRGVKFGTRGPLVYNDLYYGTDLEILAFGSLSLQVTDPEKFIKNFVPANVMSYSFDDSKVRSQILSEFLQSFNEALNSLSTKYRISQLPSQTDSIIESISEKTSNASSWVERFGFKLTSIGIESIELTPESKELVKQYSSNKMNLKSYDDASQKSSNIAAQQKIAQGIQDFGLGDGAGMIFGMNLAQNLNTQNVAPTEKNPSMSFDEQIETVKKLKNLLDAGILTLEEFNTKKKEVMNL